MISTQYQHSHLVYTDSAWWNTYVSFLVIHSGVRSKQVYSTILCHFHGKGERENASFFILFHDVTLIQSKDMLLILSSIEKFLSPVFYLDKTIMNFELAFLKK